MYEQQLSVLIKADDHEMCLDAAKHVKQLCAAWGFCVSYSEHKSARTGDVLYREIMIRQTAHARSTIAFREALSCICSHFDIYSRISVTIIDHGTSTKDARVNLVNQIV